MTFILQNMHWNFCQILTEQLGKQQSRPNKDSG